MTRVPIGSVALTADGKLFELWSVNLDTIQRFAYSNSSSKAVHVQLVRVGWGSTRSSVIVDMWAQPNCAVVWDAPFGHPIVVLLGKGYAELEEADDARVQKPAPPPPEMSMTAEEARAHAAESLEKMGRALEAISRG